MLDVVIKPPFQLTQIIERRVVDQATCDAPAHTLAEVILRIVGRAIHLCIHRFVSTELVSKYNRWLRFVKR